jgi:hypothetical protein
MSKSTKLTKDTFKGLKTKEVLDNLEAMAVKVEPMIIRRPLSEDEIELRKNEVVEKSIAKAVLDKQFDEVREEFKNQIDPLKSRLKTLIEDLQTRTKEEEGDVYHIPDYDEGFMCFYDAAGVLINKRPLHPEEKKQGDGLVVKIERQKAS